jgi:DNA-binding MarR family transcriptional regulator
VKRGPDPADVRRNRLEITPAGRELLARLDTTFAEVQDQLFAGLGATDRAELARLLDLVLQQLSPLPAKIS